MTQNDNQMNLIKSGLLNYMGSIQAESPYDERGAKQQVTSIVIEQLMKICKDGQNIDYFALKPMLRATRSIILSYGSQSNDKTEIAVSNAAAEMINQIIEYIK